MLENQKLLIKRVSHRAGFQSLNIVQNINKPGTASPTLMLVQESYWLKKIIEELVKENSTVLNIGSQTLYFRTKQQPFIQKNIFDLLDSKHCKTIHVDLQKLEGVDEVGDLTDPSFIKKLRKYDSDVLICSNILEHL